LPSLLRNLSDTTQRQRSSTQKEEPLTQPRSPMGASDWENTQHPLKEKSPVG